MIKINYFINIKFFILNFINFIFVIKKKLLKKNLLKFYKLRFINNKFILYIIYITLIKLFIKNYIKNL